MSNTVSLALIRPLEQNSHCYINEFTDTELERSYSLIPPIVCKREHHCAIIYRQSKIDIILDTYQPNRNLRSKTNLDFVKNGRI